MPDENKTRDKRNQLDKMIEELLAPSYGARARPLALELSENFVNVTPPIAKPIRFELITINSGGRGGGGSVRLGNVTLNLRKLITGLASGTLTIAGSLATPWALIPGALVTWDSLYSCLYLEIGEDEASLIWALWKNKDDKGTIAKEDVERFVNEERAEFGRAELSDKEVQFALENLTRIGCLKESTSDGNRLWLRERVRISYS